MRIFKRRGSELVDPQLTGLRFDQDGGGDGLSLPDCSLSPEAGGHQGQADQPRGGNPPIPGVGWKKKVTSEQGGPGGKMSVYCVNPAPSDQARYTGL